MLATYKNILYPGHIHLLTTGTDDPSLSEALATMKMSGHQYGSSVFSRSYDLEKRHFERWLAWWLPGG